MCFLSDVLKDKKSHWILFSKECAFGMLEATCDIATGDQWSPVHQGSLMLIVHTKVDRHILCWQNFHLGVEKIFENMGVKLLSNLTLLYWYQKSCVYFLISYAILEYCSLPFICHFSFTLQRLLMYMKIYFLLW